MHLYISPRGIIHDTNRFLNDLQAQYFAYEPKGKMREIFERNMNAKIPEGTKVGVQLAVRPMGLFYELVFPKESLQDVLHMIWPGEEFPKSANWKIDAIKWGMCKALGARRFNKKDWTVGWSTHTIYKQNVGIDLIGIKEDAYDADGNEML